MQIEDAGKVRVLVLGDSGVGKSTLVHRIVYGRSRNDKLKLTNVCDLDVWMYRKEDGQSYYVEFIDVSGSAEFGEIRSVFYRQINGIMLVFDSSNPASYNNLKKWIKEIVDANQQTSIAESLFLKVEELPLICVGTRSSSSDWKSKGHDALVQFGISTILVVNSFVVFVFIF
jgi:Rab-like protein 3